MLDELRTPAPLEFNAILQHYQEITPKLLSNLNITIVNRNVSKILRAW